MQTLKKILIAMALAVPLVHAQLTTGFAGQRNAVDYAYGLPGVAFPALSVAGGNSVAGSSSITLVTGATVMSSGTTLYPLNVNAPITIGIGSNADAFDGDGNIEARAGTDPTGESGTTAVANTIPAVS